MPEAGEESEESEESGESGESGDAVKDVLESDLKRDPGLPTPGSGSASEYEPDGGFGDGEPGRLWTRNWWSDSDVHPEVFLTSWRWWGWAAFWVAAFGVFIGFWLHATGPGGGPGGGPVGSLTRGGSGQSGSSQRVDDLRGWGRRLDVLEAGGGVPPGVELAKCWETGLRLRFSGSGRWTVAVVWRGPGEGRRDDGDLRMLRFKVVGGSESALLTGVAAGQPASVTGSSCELIAAWRGWA